MEARKIAIEEGIIATLDFYNLDALVLPAWTDMSIYAAWARKSLSLWYFGWTIQ